MDDQTVLAEQFEQRRGRLRAVAYRMLGSLSEADDALQDAWLRVSRADVSAVENLDAWLTTVVARVCLNALRARTTRREQPLDTQLPDPIVAPVDGSDPEHEALLADSIGLALVVVLQTLTPAERLAFVLHDMFGVPFDAIGAIVERTPEAARQLASRARHRVQDADPVPDADLAAQWQVVDAFLAASRDGDFDALLAVLHPDVVLRSDAGASVGSQLVRGAETVAGRSVMSGRVGLVGRRALVNGAAGAVGLRRGAVETVLAFTVREGRIVELDILVDAERIAGLGLTVFEEPPGEA